MLASEVTGLQNRGIIVFTKHFLLNDTERNRYGVAGSFSNEVCLAAREVMLRIVKLLRGEVSAVYKRSFNIIYFVFLQECIDKRGKLCYHKQCRVEYGT